MKHRLWFVAVTAVASGDLVAQPHVTIEGGTDASLHNYTWAISHDHDAPLVYVEMPHYRADFFSAPQGWAVEIVNKNSLDLKPGKCIAQPEAGAPGLERGRRAVFSMRVNPANAPRGQAEAVYRFADGVEIRQMMELPVRPSSFEQWAPVAALAGMFSLYLAIQTARKRRRRRA